MANDDGRRDPERDRERGSDERDTRHSRAERMARPEQTGGRNAGGSGTDGGADDGERSPWKSSRNQG